ncbi:MAG: ParB-like nuclease domain-containing protein [Sedimentisphaerales bacterium]|nr:ParB-like nuclease domain-containing protein [Sedimentisphaerales bacterium]
MSAEITSIQLSKLVAHPANPNVMSRATFRKLVANIEQTGRYEPLVVRPHPQRRGFFQIINGHHRCKALQQLGCSKADCVVWDVDDEQTDILLATLNRLCGRDELDKKLALLARLRERMDLANLAKLLPHTAKQISRLTRMKLPDIVRPNGSTPILSPMVFFLSDEQKQIIDEAMRLAMVGSEQAGPAKRSAAAIAKIAGQFLKAHAMQTQQQN